MVARNSAPAEGETLSITRVFDAPRELVWAAFTEPAHLAKWWGPAELRMVDCTVDARPGGIFHYQMRAPDGGEMWGKWVFREVVAPERLTIINSFSDKDANTVHGPGHEEWPLEILVTMTFEDMGEKTRINMTVAAHNATGTEQETFNAGMDSMDGGFNGTLDQLDAYLAEIARGAA